MGDFPLMTRPGTFIINGAERVVVGQLVRSPGVYFTETRTRPQAGCCSRQAHPEPRRLARVRDQQQGPAVGQGRPQAQDRCDHPPRAVGYEDNDEISALYGSMDSDAEEHPFIAQGP